MVTIEFLDAYARAWNAHDVDAIMAAMTPDCIMEMSAGPDANGRRLIGRAAVRGAIEAFFSAMPDAQWNHPAHFVAGDRGVTEWTFTATGPGGARLEQNGCDLFVFRNGRIHCKNSYRKQRA